MKTKAFTIFSLCADQDQVFVDTVHATSLAQARAQVEKNRPYATLDDGGEKSHDYIKALKREAEDRPYLIRIGSRYFASVVAEAFGRKKRLKFGFDEKGVKTKILCPFTVEDTAEILNALIHIAGSDAKAVYCLETGTHGWRILKLDRTGCIEKMTKLVKAERLVKETVDFIYEKGDHET